MILDNKPVLAMVPPPRIESSSSKKGLRDFPNGQVWKDELFRHAVACCQILCPDYWNRNRNLFSVGSRTPEDLAQTIMEQLWVKKYSSYLDKEIAAAEHGGVVKIQVIDEHGNEHETTIDPFDRTIETFRKQFYRAAERICKIQNRYCRAKKRHNEESTTLSVEEMDDHHFGSIDHYFSDTDFDYTETRIAMLRVSTERSFSQIERDLISDGIAPTEVRRAIESVKKKISNHIPNMNYSQAWRSAIDDAKKLMEKFTPDVRHDKFRALKEAAPNSSERQAIGNEIVSLMIPSMLLRATSVGISRWKVKNFVTKLTKNARAAVRAWCERHDRFPEERREIEAEIREELGLTVERQQRFDEEFRAFSMRRNEFNRQLANGEIPADQIESMQTDLETEEEAFSSVRTTLRSLEVSLTRELKQRGVFVEPSEESFYAEIGQAVSKTLQQPEPGDLVETQYNPEELREIADHARGKGLTSTKPVSQQIAEIVESWPIEMQDVLYDALLDETVGKNLKPHRVVERINNIQKNAHGLLQADYRVLSEYFKVELNAMANPMVALRAIDMQIRESPALGVNMPKYVSEVLTALRETCQNFKILGEVVKEIPTDIGAIVKLPGVNVAPYKGSQTQFEITPIRVKIDSLWPELQGELNWTTWLKSMNLTAELVKEKGKENDPGGKIVLTGDSLRYFTSETMRQLFMIVIRQITEYRKYAKPTEPATSES